ncbi:MAG: hypothetical protein BWZ10_02759 [candidate division BRC1 bacterium ADurb.BinA364]|nr:MAG: hypothetical protein BWZ10_02759 [candidate division BRC1 bacterium ADurb.BinA364]
MNRDAASFVRISILMLKEARECASRNAIVREKIDALIDQAQIAANELEIGKLDGRHEAIEACLRDSCSAPHSASAEAFLDSGNFAPAQ